MEMPGDAAPPRPPGAVGYGLPRGLIIVLGLAAGVIVAAGMHAVPDILGPVFLALVLVITVDPLRGMMIRRGAPRWLATLVLVLGMYAIIIGLMVAGIIGVARFASLLPQYADELQSELSGLKSWLQGLGITQADVQKMLSSVDKSTIVSYAASLLSSLAGVFTSLFFIITLLIFLAVDGVGVRRPDGQQAARSRAGPDRARHLRRRHPEVLRGGHHFRRHRRGPGRGGPAHPRHSGRRACGRCWPSSPTTSPTSGSSSG